MRAPGSRRGIRSIVVSTLCVGTLVATAGSSRGEPDAVWATAYVSPERVLLGQTFSLIVVIDTDSDDELQAELPSSLALGPGLEVGRRFKEKIDGSARIEVQIELTAWRVGASSIPPIPVSIPRHGRLETVYTDPVAFEVAGLAHEQATIRDDTSPITVTREDTTRLYVLVGGLVLVLISLGSLVWLRRRRADSARNDTAIAPEQRALAALAALADSSALERDDPIPVFRAMSDIMRQYLGARFGVPIQATTDEFILALSQIAGSTEDAGLTDELVCHAIQPWLETCDLVKFASARVSADEVTRAHEAAIEIVTRTTPRTP